MGIDCDAKLIVGWRVDREKTANFLLKYNVGSCEEKDKQCFCGPKYCWENREALPLRKEFTFVACSPYFDCGQAKQNIFLTLKTKSCTVEEMKALLSEADWDAARKVAVELGATDGPAQISAEPHIW